MKDSLVRVVATVEPFTRSAPPEVVIVVAVTNSSPAPLDRISVRWRCSNSEIGSQFAKEPDLSEYATCGVDLLPARKKPIEGQETGLFVAPLHSAAKMNEAIIRLPDSDHWISVFSDGTEIGHVEGSVLKASVLQMQSQAAG